MSSVPVFNSMQRPEIKTWGGVVTAAMVIALAVYMGTGECSLLSPPSFWSSFPREFLCTLSWVSTSVDIDLN